MDVLAQLSQEHASLRAHLEGAEAAAQRRDAAALAASLDAARSALTDALDAHIAVEEAQVFTAVGEVAGAAIVAQFSQEHREIRGLRDDILARLARGEAPFELVSRLCEAILDHQEREDAMLFPLAREALAGNAAQR